MMQGKQPQQQRVPRRFQAPPSTAEITELLEQAKNGPQSEDLRDVVEILYRTGLRLGELRELRWQEIDFESREVTIKSVKSGRVRFVPLGRKLSAILRARRERQPDSVFVLGTSPRTTVDRVARQFRILSGRVLGRTLPLHSLRQAFDARWAARQLTGLESQAN